MAKCVNCGLTTSTRGHIEFKDGSAICEPCFTQLGFRPTEAAKMKNYSFFDIKDGAEAFDKKFVKQSGSGYEIKKTFRIAGKSLFILYHDTAMSS